MEKKRWIKDRAGRGISEVGGGGEESSNDEGKEEGIVTDTSTSN